MQLAAFNNNNFTLGHAAMTINEGLPLYVVDRLDAQYDLTNMTVGHPGDGVQGRQSTTSARRCRTSSSGS